MGLFERLAGTTLASFAISISSANATLTTSPATALTDVPAASLTISSQAPFASAVTNITPGNINLNIPSPIGVGATGFVQVQNGGVNQWLFGNQVGNSAVAAIYGPGLTPSSFNYVLAATGTTTVLNAVGTVIQFDTLGVARYQATNLFFGPIADNTYPLGNTTAAWTKLYTYNVTFPVGALASTPQIIQTPQASDIATNNLTITSQAPFASAVTNITPGNINLNVPAPVSGTGYGFVAVQMAGTSVWQFGYLVGAGADPTIYGNVVPSATNFSFSLQGNNIITNAVTGVYQATGGTARTYTNSNGFNPNANNTYSLGTAGTLAWANIYAYAYNYPAADTTASLIQATQTSDIATNNLTITSQAPFASAVTNITPGNIVLNIPAGIGTYVPGKTLFQNAGTTIGGIGSLNFANLGLGTLWLGTAAFTASNFAIYSDGSSQTNVNGVTSVSLDINGVGYFAVSTTLASLQMPTLAFLSNVVGATIQQNTISTITQGRNLTITPQQSTQATNNGGGNLIVALQTPAGTGTEANFQITRGGTLFAAFQFSSSLATFYLGSGEPLNTTAFSLQSNATNLTVNAPGAAGTLSFSTGATAYAQMTSSVFGFAVPIGGNVTTPLSFKGQTSPNTVACGTGGTQVISAAQSIIPFFLVTTGTLTSNAIVSFTANAPTGYFLINLSGVGTLGTSSLQFVNGSATVSVTATALANLIATGANSIQIATYGANTLSLF